MTPPKAYGRSIVSRAAGSRESFDLDALASRPQIRLTQISMATGPQQTIFYRPRQHRELLAVRLQSLTPQASLFFGVWCLEGIWLAAEAHLMRLLSAQQRKTIVETHDALIAASLGRTAFAAQVIVPTIIDLQLIQEAESQMEVLDHSGVVALVGALDPLAAGKPNAPSTAAMCALELIYEVYRLCGFEGELWSAPMLLDEVRAQLVLLDALEESKPSRELLAARRPLVLNLDSDEV